MKRIIIDGNRELTGKIKISGAKNSVVALLPATILSTGKVNLSNVPNISDKNALVDIMELLGAKIEFQDDNIYVDSSNTHNSVITLDYTKKLRASYYFMGVLLAKYKRAEVYLPGGCKIGERPIDIHLKGFEALGATITKEEEKYIIEATQLIGCPFHLDFPSVGATINLMFTAVLAKGTTTLSNVAKEPEIVNIAESLNKMGAKISGIGTDTLVIEGVDSLGSADIEVIPDRIEGGTYIILGALLGNNLEVAGILKEDLVPLLSKLDEMGVIYKIEGRSLFITKTDNLKPVNVKSLVHPGFPTDLGQPMQVLLTKANGTSIFEETIYDNRMGHIEYLNKMGANISVDNSVATINGPTDYVGREIVAVDLRGGAALVIAGLVATGVTVIDDIDHILRGYENIINKLTEVGANIKIEEI